MNDLYSCLALLPSPSRSCTRLLGAGPACSYAHHPGTLGSALGSAQGCEYQAPPSLRETVLARTPVSSPQGPPPALSLGFASSLKMRTALCLPSTSGLVAPVRASTLRSIPRALPVLPVRRARVVSFAKVGSQADGQGWTFHPEGPAQLARSQKEGLASLGVSGA